MDSIFQYLKQQFTKENSTILSVVSKIIREESSPSEQEVFINAFKKSIERYESSVGKNDLAYNNCRQQATTQLWEDINSFPFKIQTHLRNLNNALWSEGAKRITWRDKLEKYKKSGGVKFKNQLRRAGLI
jgi:hypothetical protein